MNIYKLFIFICLIFTTSFSHAKDISSRQIDRIVEDVMEVFSVPGAAVGVINKGKIIHAKGYGRLSIADSATVNTQTYFGIASNSKGFTATALALLVADGKITWDDKVKDHLNHFQMSDPWLTDHFTIRDLLSHSTGLPLGSGDLMWWPDSNYSADEIIKNMRYLKPNREFRTTYEYNNIPFIVAGAIIPAITGQTYEQFLAERIFKPLNMTRCTANTPMIANDNNIAAPHAVLDNELTQIKRYLVIDQVAGSIAAAGIQCSIDDLLKWEMMHINHGKGLLPKNIHNQLWQINTPMSVSKNNIQNGTNFRGYGLGYNISDYFGTRVISHGGALIGMYSFLSMIPELNLAIAVTTNQQSASAYASINNQIRDHIMDISGGPTAKQIFDANEGARNKDSRRLNNLTGNGRPSQENTAYTGVYNDPWWHDVTISELEGGLYFRSKRSPSLHGKLEYFEGNKFVVRWNDRTHEADAYINFSLNEAGETIGFTMEAISPRTDFSYDFHHLNMVKK